MSDDFLINVENISKRFCRTLKRSLWYGVRDIGYEIWGGNGDRRTLRPGEFWAVDDISFQVRRGECLGLIGPNGSGKSTLLKMLTGLIKPDAGRITMRGRVAALIQLGAGFNPILTGRENIYNNAAVLGMGKREVDRHLDAIIDFADIADAVDAPVRSYSSGMRVRLGFAVAAHLEPDVLLLDEVLAVGDAAFRDKCYRRIVEVRRSAAVIFVSHIMEQVGRVCDNTMLLSRGKKLYFGSSGEGISMYEELNTQKGDNERGFLSLDRPIVSFAVGFSATQLKCGDPLTITLDVESEHALNDFVLRIMFYNTSGAFAADCNLLPQEHGITLPPGKSRWRVNLDAIPLRSGRYRAAFNIIDRHGDLVVWSYKQHDVDVSGSYPGALADCQLQPTQWLDITENEGVAS